MPDYPISFLRHTLLWNLPGGERAACSVHWNSGAGEISIDTTESAAFAARGLALWDAIKDRYSNQTFYVGSRLSIIGTDGKSHDTTEMGNSPSAGTINTHALPQEVAVVATLLSASGTKSGRGRIYLPAPARDQCGDGSRLESAARADFATNVAAYCADLDIAASTYTACVASGVQSQLRPIIQVRVGDVFDSQRRRRDTLTEVYSVVGVPA